jgi:hypothetical protein
MTIREMGATINIETRIIASEWFCADACPDADALAPLDQER